MEYFTGEDDFIGEDGQEQFWDLQESDSSCAVVAQVGILERFGIDMSEEEAVYDSFSNGWLTEGGTSPDDVGNLLELNGVPCHRMENASIHDLASELQDGHSVIVGVNSSELWDTNPFWDWFYDLFGLDDSESNPADHAISITGIDISNPEQPMVVINDSGHLEGAGAQYPLDEFMDAWGNSDFTYVATNSAPSDIDSMLGDFNIVEFLEGASVGDIAAVGLHSSGVVPMPIGVAAGRIIDFIIDDIDWDEILVSV